MSFNLEMMSITYGNMDVSSNISRRDVTEVFCLEQTETKIRNVGCTKMVKGIMYSIWSRAVTISDFHFPNILAKINPGNNMSGGSGETSFKNEIS